MSRVCEVCGKSPSVGNSVTRRGLAKAKGGVGIKTTGISRRKFYPNLQKIRVIDDKGTARRMKVCTKCIRSGKVKKRVS
jgi:large subunit ribosomal protein L28